MAGLGYAVGPSVGGLLYEYGGFGLPFLVLAAIIFVISVGGLFLLIAKPCEFFQLLSCLVLGKAEGLQWTGRSLFEYQHFEDSGKAGGDLKRSPALLKLPAMWLMLSAVLLCGVSFSFLEPTLAVHLSPVCFLLCLT